MASMGSIISFFAIIYIIFIIRERLASQRPILSLYNSNSSLDLIQCCPPFDHSYESGREPPRPSAAQDRQREHSHLRGPTREPVAQDRRPRRGPAVPEQQLEQQPERGPSRGEDGLFGWKQQQQQQQEMGKSQGHAARRPLKKR